jgi:hypothetical protein
MQSNKRARTHKGVSVAIAGEVEIKGDERVRLNFID